MTIISSSSAIPITPASPLAKDSNESAQGDSPSFADVLASLLNGGTDDRLSADDTEQRAVRFAGAQVFNADGFFQGAAGAQPPHSLLSGGPAVVRADILAPMPADEVADVPSPPSPQIATEPDAVALMPGTRHSAGGPPVAGPPTASRQLLATKAPVRPDGFDPMAMAVGRVPATAGMAEEDTAGEPIANRQAGQRLVLRMPFAERNAPLGPQISVQALAHGLHVVAKVEELARVDRVRLRDRIAAILARHGFAIDTVRLDARLPADAGQSKGES